MTKLIVLLVFVALIALVESHGYVRVPLSRTSIFRDPSFGAQLPFWWDDSGVWCGNVPQDLQYSTCGRCGDAPGNTGANQGGRYDKGIITGRYTAGEAIDVFIHFTANHRGHFEFDLCPSVTENDNCFERLNIIGGTREIRSGNMMCSGDTYEDGLPIDVTARVQLPANVRCARCTLRWTYRTSYQPAPDACFQPNPTQTFRNCVDIAIS